MDFCTLLREANKSLFKCSECGKTFNLINTFRVHLNRSHGIFFKPIRIRNKKLSKNKKRQFMKPRRAQSALDPCKEEPRSPSPNPALCFEKKDGVDFGLEDDPEEEKDVSDDFNDYQEILPDDEIDKVGVTRRRCTRVIGTNSRKAGDSVSEEDDDDDELSLSEYSETEENTESSTSKSEDDSDDHESEGEYIALKPEFWK